MNRAAFLDRDGVINRASIIDGRPYPPSSLEKLEILAGVSSALDNLRRAGFLTIVVTNQPDVATGKQERAVVEAMHRHLKGRLELTDIFVCYHTDDDQCDCRKPKPGMLIDAARKWSIDLSHSYMVGDRWRDIDAGRQAGCKTCWVRDPANRERVPERQDWIVQSLLEASQLICSQTTPSLGKHDCNN